VTGEASSSCDVDIAIVGGGLVGTSLALALRHLPLRIALIEAQAANCVPAPSWDERCIGLNAASQQILDALGVWPEIAAEAAPILSTHIGEAGRFGVSRFSCEEAGLPALGHNTPLRVLNTVLGRHAAALPQLRVLAPARVTGLQLQDRQATLTLDSMQASALVPAQLTAQLVVAADGAHSSLRQMLGIRAQHRDYGQKAIVTAVRPQRSTAGVAYERFLPTGPLAVLPKPADAQGHAASIVWTLPSDQADTAMSWSDDEFLLRLEAALGGRLGRLRSLGKRGAYPLERVLADSISGLRFVLVGNAAQALHPVAAQGFNLGLRDVATLAEVLQRGGDPGRVSLTADYAQRRSDDRQRAAGFTDALVRVFSNRMPGLSALRHLGLLALDLTPAMKARVMRENLGYAGHVPRLARP
jgi:2-octaprenyl-6-methoxyphenol hydroxylase